MDTGKPSSTHRATAWLSQGLESLYPQIAKLPDDASEQFHFDVLIVGSGYGGAIALSRLAGHAQGDRPLKLCMLERGQEHLPGSFPSRFADLAGHVRFSTQDSTRARGMRSGVIDVRVGPDVHAILGNGLGGGSLINAGVMATPLPSVFEHPRWPAPIRSDAAGLLNRAQHLKAELGAEPVVANLQKTAFMRALAGKENRMLELDVQVTQRDGPNAQGVAMRACLNCGDCATGCNHQAKASLDTNLLVAARKCKGVEIYTGATVLSVKPLRSAGWCVTVVHTDEKRRVCEQAPLELHARYVILAAGTFGTTEILMRSSGARLALSPLLGQRFSANGDSLAAVYDASMQANCAANEGTPWDQRTIGPTITACIDLRTGDPAKDFVIEDISAPGPSRSAFEQIVLTANSLAALGESDKNTYRSGEHLPDINAVDTDKIEHTLLVAMIGHDDANGRMVLKRSSGPDAANDGDGAVSVEWPELRDDPRFAWRQRELEKYAAAAELDSAPPVATRLGRILATVAKLVSVAPVAKLGGRVLANPVWRPLSESVADVLGAPRGPLTTVHPLGGCTMGENGADGVVDQYGRVFRGCTDKVHDGLVVLDGSIVPTSLGINPALTIAALADRAIETLRDRIWNFIPAAAAAPAALAFPRPYFCPPITPKPPKPTRVIIAERLRGQMELDIGAGCHTYDVQLDLYSQPLTLASLMQPVGPRRIEIDPLRSELGVYKKVDPNAPGLLKRGDALLIAEHIEGHLDLFEHAASTAWRRRLCALWAWLRNRGLRDTVQYLYSCIAGHARSDVSSPPLGRRLTMAFALASRTGDTRLLEYDLHFKTGEKMPPTAGRIVGRKELVYSFAANPWQQLMLVTLSEFPWCAAPSGKTLSFDLRFVEKARVLLLSLHDQQDMPTTLAELGAFLLYVARTLLHVHVWSFRKPDSPPGREFARLPGHLHLPDLPDFPPPQITEFVTSDVPLPNGAPVLARLTRYRRPDALVDAAPVLLIHGYSASGTTFAHESIVDGGLAGHLCTKKRDVWVLDLRSSCGMPSAREPWTFEEVGYSDIPLAIDHVLRATGRPQLDIVAHCMGAAMLSLALFGRYPARPGPADPQLALRRLLPKRIRRLVFSQVGPALYMAPANVTRGYLMRYLQNYLPLESYRFRAEGDQGPGTDGLDRLLSTVPYSRDEFRLENPLWPLGALTPWASVRHRMDALYGVTFKLANMSKQVLDRIDDFFGPMNVRTITQVIHFAHSLTVTDSLGACCYANQQVVTERLVFPVLSLHSEENGLVSVATADAMRTFLGDQHEVEVLPRCGHQDSLIGIPAIETFKKIASFLEK